jgi:chemotaxis signal transduction protein
VEASRSEPASRAGQYLTFRLARIEFAVEVASLRGILPGRALEPIAPSPQLCRRFGKEICGSASIRGRDIPVVDLRGRLNLPHGTHGRNPCIIVVEIPTEEGPHLAGFIADRVAKVIHVRPRDFLRGKLKFGGRSLNVLDPELLLAASESPRLA